MLTGEATGEEVSPIFTSFSFSLPPPAAFAFSSLVPYNERMPKYYTRDIREKKGEENKKQNRRKTHVIIAQVSSLVLA